MPDRLPRTGNKTEKRGKGHPDANVLAWQVVQMATGEMEKPPVKKSEAVTLGRMGGLKGGRSRAAKLTPEQRSAIARKAADSRWHLKG